MGGVATVGYERRTVDELITALTEAAVEVLVDVRLTPLSRKPGLSKKRLAVLLQAAGIDYLHLPHLGNPRDNRDAFRRARQGRRRTVSSGAEDAGRPSGTWRIGSTGYTSARGIDVFRAGCG